MHHATRTRLGAALVVAALTTLPVTAAATASPVPEETQEDARLLLLLDASGSMADPDADGTPKIDTAKTALTDVIDSLNPDQHVGLRVFGGEVPIDQPRDAKCTDSQLVVPIGTDNATALTDAVADYTPTGETPIAYALQQSATDLGDSGNRTVLLVSDGIATCDPDPCEVAEQLTADGLDLVVHTVGLGVDDATRSQLQCIADAAGGTYYDADDTDTLTTALTRITTRAFRPFSIAGDPVEGSVDQASAPSIEAGQYVDTMRHQQASYYLVERSEPGASLHIGATMRPNEPSGFSTFEIGLQTLEGDRCDGDVVNVLSMGGGNSFGSGGVTGYADARDPEDPCGTDEQLLLSLTEQGGSELGDHPVEIWVHEEAPTESLTGLPDNQAQPIWEGVETGTPVAEVVGGTAFNDATPLQAGATYTSDIVPGEVLVFSVPVDWGQHLETLIEYPQPDPSLAEHIGGGLATWSEVNFYGPDRGDAVSRLADTGELSMKEHLSPTESAVIGGITFDVEWNNRRWGNPKAADRPGDYYVVVSMNSTTNSSVPIPFMITNEVVGEVSGAPTYAQAAGTDGRASEAAAQTAATTDALPEGAADDQADSTTGPEAAAETASPELDGPADTAGGTDGTDGTDGGSGIGPAVWVLGGVGAALAAGGAVLLAVRRR